MAISNRRNNPLEHTLKTFIRRKGLFNFELRLWIQCLQLEQCTEFTASFKHILHGNVPDSLAFIPLPLLKILVFDTFTFRSFSAIFNFLMNSLFFASSRDSARIAKSSTHRSFQAIKNNSTLNRTLMNA